MAAAAQQAARPAPRRGRRPPARRATIALALLLAALAAGLAAAGPAAATFRSGDDWRHVEATLKALNRHPKGAPVVLLLGGSAARECISTEPGWRAQIAAMGGGSVRAFNLGSSSQAYRNDLTIVRAAPAVPTIVLIGLNVGRYTSIPRESVAVAPAARASSVYDSHRFHAGDQLSDSAKRALVGQWLRVKYPRFRARYAGNAATLRELIAACLEKGFRPVLVELPINLRIVGHAWDAPRGTYRRGCRRAARAAGIPYVDFVARAGLTSGDFVDLAHLVEPGRAKYQRQLSHVVVARLRRYGLTGRAISTVNDPTPGKELPTDHD